MKMVLVLDCGASTVRAITVSSTGNLVHAESRPNAAVRQFKDKNWLVWDTESIWKKLVECAGIVVRKSGPGNIIAVTAASFSDDGAPVDRQGRLCYPVISWQCSRTIDIANSIDTLIPFSQLYSITGEQVLRQHTLFRLLWLKENAPGVLEKAHRYLMFPGILNYRLTGEFVNDPTTADSMMLLDVRKRKYSRTLLEKMNIDESLFGTMLEPGRVIGSLVPSVARQMGLKPGVPVVVSGHDTQFAVCGSGCGRNEAVLSSGTWEILFLRGGKCITTGRAREAGLKNECDAVPGLFNSGFQWIGSGSLDWLLRLGRQALGDSGLLHRKMKASAGKIPPGSNGVMVHPSFLPGAGINRRNSTGGIILGLSLQTGESEIYRAFLEGLSYQLREAMEKLSLLSGVHPDHLIVVGGGSRNGLWNRIRADVLGIPVKLSRQAENTVLGAAMFAFIGAGYFRNCEEASANIPFFKETIEPSPVSAVYSELYSKFKRSGLQ